MFQALICDRKRKEKHFLLKLRAQFCVYNHRASAKKAQKYIKHRKECSEGSIQPELNLEQKESREQAETIVPLI